MDKRNVLLMRSFAIIFTVVLSSTLFLFLYNYDNKYTKTSAQPINGLLYVSETDWNETSVRYIIHGWKYFEDRLLTPETLKQQGDDYRYISIGEYASFASGDFRRSPHGSASYALTLSLPEKIHTYSIELPEIYSAFRFYINDSLKLQMGDPYAENYRDQTQCRMITFEASGKTELLLSVSNQSWIYSGLVYPPAFGEPLSLNTTRGVRIGLRIIIVTMALMLAVFSLYLFIRARRKGNILVFFLLCLATAASVSYPVVHGILALPVQPWYSIELASGYAVTLLVIVLHNRICFTGRHISTISMISAAAVCAVSLIYGLFASMLSMPVMLTFSNMVFGFKISASVYLIFTAASAVRKNVEKADILLYADILYACSLLWDRLLPQYEPVFGGWFQEWGSMSLVIATGTVMWYEIAMGYRNSLVYAEEQRQLKRQLGMQVEHLRQMNQKLEESAKLRHDFRHHLRTLMTLSEEGRSSELESYIRGITEINEGTRLGRITENIELDALIQYYSSLARSEGIEFKARLWLPEVIEFPIVDLCGLLGNLLENAVEACQRQESGEKSIFIAGRENEGQLEFVVDNSFSGELKTSGEKYLSSKRNGFGIGISSVRETVYRYGGAVNIYADNDGFHAEISLPDNQKLPETKL